VANGVDAATAGEIQSIDKLAQSCYFGNIRIGWAADKELVACKRPFGDSALADLQELQREDAAFSPLFFAQVRRHNSRVSAAKPMPLAANFLQKQQKQRQRPCAKGCYGNSVNGWRRRRRPRLNNLHSNNSSLKVARLIISHGTVLEPCNPIDDAKLMLHFNLKESSRCRPAAGAAVSDSTMQFMIVVTGGWLGVFAP
jgi:hypothetical protein